MSTLKAPVKGQQARVATTATARPSTSLAPMFAKVSLNTTNTPQTLAQIALPTNHSTASRTHRRAATLPIQCKSSVQRASPAPTEPRHGLCLRERGEGWEGRGGRQQSQMFERLCRSHHAALRAHSLRLNFGWPGCISATSHNALKGQHVSGRNRFLIFLTFAGNPQGSFTVCVLTSYASSFIF